MPPGHLTGCRHPQRPRPVARRLAPERAGPGLRHIQQNRFVQAKDPAAARNFSATLLHNGQVLTSGGENGTYPAKETITTAATLFDPATAASTDTGSMTIPRQFHTLTVLPNRQVRAADGQTQKKWGSSTSTASAELYIP